MKLVTVEVEISQTNASTAAELFEAQAPAVRALSGCESYCLYSSGNSRIVIIQKWVTMKAFDGYRDSDVFTKMGAGLKPLMTAPPVTTIAEIDG